MSVNHEDHSRHAEAANENRHQTGGVGIHLSMTSHAFPLETRGNNREGGGEREREREGEKESERERGGKVFSSSGL